jgi:hypothetical protein
MRWWFINMIFKRSHYLIVLLPTAILANPSDIDYFSALKLNILAYTNVNNFLLQCIIALLLVMIFGYAGKLLYERKINKE